MFGAGPFIHTEDAISIPAYFHVPFEISRYKFPAGSM